MGIESAKRSEVLKKQREEEREKCQEIEKSFTDQSENMSEQQEKDKEFKYLLEKTEELLHKVNMAFGRSHCEDSKGENISPKDNLGDYTNLMLDLLHYQAYEGEKKKKKKKKKNSGFRFLKKNKQKTKKPSNKINVNGKNKKKNNNKQEQT
eukprot:TRINITY_DN66687_c0_g1_i1.p2 TRINITY_DN66687_c0_g1~~TRINITY_DN66687_c0_g1_i1.p2  ORF type:complete len:151 (-),score=45.24 TRINITY_DN66687_c0_g1_i1:53-505(-)